MPGFSLLVVLLLLVPAVARAQDPIPEGPDAAGAPRFSGEAWTPRPVRAPEPPRHPFMAANDRSNLHADAFQTDTHRVSGPLGHGTARRDAFYVSDCASHTFDSEGRLITVCVGLTDVTLRLLDPRTLATLASYDLPARPVRADTFQNFTGGGYFYLDHRDRAVIPTAARHILVVGLEGTTWVPRRDVDLTGVVPEDDALISALPDWSGRIWFATRGGIVGTIGDGGEIVAVPLHEPITNSFAVDSDGSVSIVTDVALYRFEAYSDGRPRVVWREVYANTGAKKPGQTQAGSGTTPTLIGRDRVAITDNDDPIHVLVFQRGRRATGERLLCRVAVFEPGASSTDQSLIATPDFIVAENNHGYTGPAATQNGASTARGLARVDLDPTGRGCHVRWRSDETAPTVVPKLSRANGLVYTYTKEPRRSGEDWWYLTALDAETGRTAFKAFAGEGLGHNNNYAPVTLGPDGTAYVGVLGGIVALRDDRPVPDPPPAFRPSASLTVRCGVARVRTNYGRHVRIARRVDARAPFAVRVGRRSTLAVRALVTFRDGSTRRLRARPRPCARP